MSNAKPVIFISYSHKDEPEKPRDGEIAWLSFVRTYLQPAIKHGVFDIFVDEHVAGGAQLKPEIEAKLKACDIFLLLISANSVASDYIIDTEIAVTRERQEKGEDVVFYPLLIEPTPKVALEKFFDMNVRPKDAKPLFEFALNERKRVMTEIANEIADLAAKIVSRKPPPPPPPLQPGFVHISGLPETPYEHLVGRDGELKRLDEALTDKKTNILSLIAEGGAGKSALVNEWLKRMQADNYRGAEIVLGYSFYSQGSKERATSADEFLNWALDRLEVKTESTNSMVKGEVIAEALMHRRVLLLLDGVEPLQHGPGGQTGQLKDQGMRALLRHFAAMATQGTHGLIVLTSRLPIKDIDHWKGGAAPVLEIERLSEDAGAALLRDNGVWGTDRNLKQAVRNFGGHALALGLLASFLTETQKGDVRRRDGIRGFLADRENSRHDHAFRVMESYEKEWLIDQPVLLAIMRLVGLFDRPANGGCLDSLRRSPAISGLTDQIVELNDDRWERSVGRLRDVRLLAPIDPEEPEAIDAHPLVREWFGERLEISDKSAWSEAHGRLYEYLRDNTEEGVQPRLEDMGPLYQAIAHGCRSGRHQEALADIYVNRICRREMDGSLAFYASKKLGATATNLSAVSWFFEQPFKKPVSSLLGEQKSWIRGQAAIQLRALGRMTDALQTLRASLSDLLVGQEWANAATICGILSGVELAVGEIKQSVSSGRKSFEYAERSGNDLLASHRLSTLATVLHASGRREEAEQLFAASERRQRQAQPKYPLLCSREGYALGDLLLSNFDYISVHDRATSILGWQNNSVSVLDEALTRLLLARSALGLAHGGEGHKQDISRQDMSRVVSQFEEVLRNLRAAGQAYDLPRGLIAYSVFKCCIGNWEGAARDLDEVEEIADPQMRLHLCDLALGRARLALAQIEAFAPFNGAIGNAVQRLEVPTAKKRAELKDRVGLHLRVAGGFIEECGYHRRDAELAELQSVLKGERTFASLPIHV